MLGMQQFKNRVRFMYPEASFILHNIRINGVLKGFSGFIRFGDRVVYVNTDVLPFGVDVRYLYRVAKDEKDFCGGVNKYAAPDNFAAAVVGLGTGGNA